MKEKRRTILVVDDEKHNLTAIGKLLRKDYNVILSTSVEDGIEKLKKEKVHLVVADQRMPEKSGVDLLQYTRKNFPEIVRIILTGYADISAAIDAINRGGVFRYIQKPWEQDDFINTVRHGIERYDLFEKNKNLIKELKQAKDYTDSIIKSIRDTLVVVDPTNKIQTVNRATEELLGYRADELIGKPVGILFAEPFKKPEFDDLIKKEVISNVEKTYLTKDGRKIPVLFSGSVMRDDYGKIQGIVYVALDITEHKRAEEEARKMHQGLVEAHEKLQRAYEGERQLRDKLIQSEKLASLGQMGAKIAHEINNPLIVILGRAGLWQSRDIGEELKKTFKLIALESMRIKNITSTYMNLSKPTLPKKELLDLNKVVKESVENLITTGDIKNYSIKKELQPDLPEVIGDYDRLVQVFRNLIVNASHAMADSEEKILTFQSSVSKDGKFAEVSIHDTGSGIEKEKLDKIFEIYYTTKANGLGTGLGLVVVKDIVEKQHKGKVLIESEIGKGTTFTVQLPLRIERKRKRILIADDEAYIRELFVTFLEKCGMEVFEACNGIEALENFEKVQPDIVLSDIKMPVMDGFELVEEIRSRKPEQKIILMTGYYYEPQIKEKLEKHNIPFFTKPAYLDAIWKMVKDELKK